MSSRALFDAMQMLESKEDVTVVTIADSDLPSLDFGPTIETTLERHGIKSEHLILDRGSKTKASLLLDVCKQKDAGILVMGAYERSKLAEDLFGGTTDDVLNAAHLPVFLSH